jgi:hypothetical protein
MMIHMDRGTQVAVVIFLIAVLVMFALGFWGYMTGGWESPSI